MPPLQVGPWEGDLQDQACFGMYLKIPLFLAFSWGDAAPGDPNRASEVGAAQEQACALQLLCCQAGSFAVTSWGIAPLFQSENQVFPLAFHQRLWRGASSHMKALGNVLRAPLRAVLFQRQGSQPAPSLRAFTSWGAAKSPKKGKDSKMLTTCLSLTSLVVNWDYSTQAWEGAESS